MSPVWVQDVLPFLMPDEIAAIEDDIDAARWRPEPSQDELEALGWVSEADDHPEA